MAVALLYVQYTVGLQFLEPHVTALHPDSSLDAINAHMEILPMPFQISNDVDATNVTTAHLLRKTRVA